VVSFRTTRCCVSLGFEPLDPVLSDEEAWYHPERGSML
jgi:hypothetical protein